MTRFAYAFAGVATFAALAGGVAGLVLGSSPTTAPTAPSVGAVQTPGVGVTYPPATIAPSVPPAPVAQPVVTRTVTIVRHQSAAPSTPKAAKPVSAPDEPVAEQAAPPAPVQAVEPAPEPAPTAESVPWSTDGNPTSMNGTPDPTLGGTTATEGPPSGGGFVH